MIKKFLLVVAITLYACKTEQTIHTTYWNHVGKSNGCHSAREEASRIGIDIMAKGGNAFDAMVATELALAVSFPYAGNIGGGGFMVFRKSTGETGAIDYREKAPMAAHRDMYLVL